MDGLWVNAAVALATALVTTGLNSEFYKRRNLLSDRKVDDAKKTTEAEIVDRQKLNEYLAHYVRELLEAEKSLMQNEIKLNHEIDKVDRERERVERLLIDQRRFNEEQAEEILSLNRQLISANTDKLALNADIERLGRELLSLRNEIERIGRGQPPSLSV